MFFISFSVSVSTYHLEDFQTFWSMWCLDLGFLFEKNKKTKIMKRNGKYKSNENWMELSWINRAMNLVQNQIHRTITWCWALNSHRCPFFDLHVAARANVVYSWWNCENNKGKKKLNDYSDELCGLWVKISHGYTQNSERIRLQKIRSTNLRNDIKYLLMRNFQK